MDSKRILLIEDDDAAIRAIRSALSDYRLDIEVVTDAEVGFERARDGSPSTIIVSVELAPHKQGYNLCRRIKKSPFRNTPVILISEGDPYLEDHKRLSTRADAYLLKPLQRSELVERLERLIGGLPRSAAFVAEEIVDLTETIESDGGGNEATIVAEIEAFESIDDDDIVDVSAEPVAVGADRIAPLPARSAPADRDSFALAEEDNFDAMLESLEFGDEPASPPSRSASLGPHASGPPIPVEPQHQAAPVAAPVLPTPPVEPEAARLPPEPAAPEVESFDEEPSQVRRVQRSRDLEKEFERLQNRLQALESAATLSQTDIAEELAARDQEIAERQAQLEDLAGQHARALEEAQGRHSENLSELRAESEKERTRLEARIAELEAGAPEAAEFQERIDAAVAAARKQFEREHGQALESAQAHASGAAAEVERLTALLHEAERETTGRTHDLEEEVRFLREQITAAQAQHQADDELRRKLRKATSLMIELLEPRR